MTRVDLIIPTSNGWSLLERCLASLKCSTYRDFTLTVFDDGSTEPIGDLVSKTWPSARVLRSDVNVGLARGCNLAIRAGSADFVVLLNNDTEVEPEWLAELVACAERHPNTGSIASKLRLASDRNRLHSAGDYFSVRGMPGNRGVWLEDFGQFDTESEIFGACAGAALYRRLALDDTQIEPGMVFDERLFMYCEDVDLAWRLQRKGWGCVFAPNAVVFHALSATAGGAFASYYVSRNIWLILTRSIPRNVLSPWRRRIAIYHLGRLVRTLMHIREPAARAGLRGTLVGLALACASARQRPHIGQEDTVRLRSLLSGG